MRVIAIDGPAGAGKSTVARALAERLSLQYLDTGAMYRGVTFAAIRRNIDPEDTERVARLAREFELDVREDRVVVDGMDATLEIRGPEVTRAVSTVAANAGVRAELRSRQVEWANLHRGGVIEGRDIGSVVFPDAELKLYLTASTDVRAQRRHKEVSDLAYEEVAAAIAERDARDQGRSDGPLLEADDAVVVDTTGRAVDEIVDEILGLLGVTKTASKFVGRSLPSRVLYVGFRAVIVAFTRLWTRTEVRGREHLPVGGFILAPVHRSNMDTPIAAVITRRRLRYMGKESLWVNPVTGWLFSSLGAFPVSRGTVDLEATKRCLDVLRGEEPLVVFPEGERKSGPKVQPLFDGAAYLALKSGKPIVPVGIGGSERVMPKGSKLIYPRKVVVIVGAPLVAGQEAGGRVHRARVDELTGDLHARIQELFDEAQAAVGDPN